MRASAVRAAIGAAIAAVSVDTRAGARDRLTYLQYGARDPDSVPERSFTIALSAQPQRAEDSAVSTYEVEYLVTIFYVSQPGVDGVEDRIAVDAERVYIACEKLHEQNADINAAFVSASGVAEQIGQVRASWNVRVNYRLTSGIE